MKTLPTPRRKPLVQAVALALLGFAAPYALSCSDSITGSEQDCLLSDGVMVIHPGAEVVGTTQPAITAFGTASAITNGGRVFGNSVGVNTSNTGTTFLLTNYDTGVIDGNQIGILIQGGTVFIDNKGSINGSSDAGIRNDGGTISNLENTGEITSDGNGIANLNVGSGAMINILTNYGKISGGIGASASGIYNNQSTIGYLTNEIGGLIQGKYGIFNDGTGGATLISLLNNKGTIFGDAVGIYNNSATINEISNSGVIGSDVTAIKITGGTVPTIINSGIISGGISGTGYSVQSDVTTNITNTGLILGRLSLTFAGSSVTNNGIHALRSWESSSITGSFTQSANGVLVLNAFNNTDYANLDVSGAAVLNGGVQVNLVTGHSITAGTVLTNVVTAGTLTGTPTIKDNSLTLNFTTTQTGTNLDLTAVAVTSTPPSGNGPTVALVDSALASGCSSSTSQQCSAAGAVTTAAELSNVLKQLEPLLVGSAQVAARSALTGIHNVIQARQEANRGLSSGEGFYGDKHVWMKPFGSWADQGDRKGVSGYEAKTGGLVFGADAVVSDATRLGLSFAYARANIDGNSNIARNRADVDVFQLLGYGSYAFDKDTELNFHAGIGQNQNKGKRSVLGVDAKSDYSSLTAMAGVGLGRTYKLSSQTSFTPSLRADYFWIKDESYTETGSVLSLKVHDRKSDELIMGIDGKLLHDLGNNLSLNANLGVGYDVLGKQSSVGAEFVVLPGQSFTTNGLDPSPWQVRGGVGFARVHARGMEASVRYDAEYRKDFLNQTLSAKLRWPF